MLRRFFVTVVVFAGIHYAAVFALRLLWLVLFVFGFAEEGEQPFAVTHVLPLVERAVELLSLPGELAVGWVGAAVGPAFLDALLIRRCTHMASSLLCGVALAALWLGPRRVPRFR